MSLVQYSDSESDSDTQLSSPPAAKRIRHNASRQRPNNQQTTSLPPLPSNFYDLYATSTRVSVQDDPNLHGGRKRVIPHVDGNWPTHLYLECKLLCPGILFAYVFLLADIGEQGSRASVNWVF